MLNFRRMKMLLTRRHIWKHALFGCALFSLIALYILSLRYTGAGGTRSTFSLRGPEVDKHLVDGLGRGYDPLHDVKILASEDHIPSLNKSSHKVKKSSNHSTIDVFVFEEHHEAIPYWFHAADTGQIPKQENILIHIDGHSDLAPPFFVPGYPFFRYPRHNELKMLMQKNDAFIQGSNMAGLISKVIWVWPHWDQVNHESKHRKYHMQIGWAAVNDPQNPGQKMKTFCMCQTNGTESECMYQSTESEEGWAGKKIPAESCHVRKGFNVEEVHELQAMKVFNDKDLILKTDNVILDIDEDFYGCTYAIQPLLDANVTLSMVKEMDNLIENIFCPKTTEHEKNSDKLLWEVIENIKLKRKCKQTRTCKLEKLNVLKGLLNSLQTANNIKTCENQGKLRLKLVTLLVKQLENLTDTQLDAMQETGFCSSTTPKTLPIFGARMFGICYGANTPNDTAVITYMPPLKEVEKRTMILQKLLSKINKFSPKLVTLCRSMRDGYTPRKFFHQIEKDILHSLSVSMQQDLIIHYDKDLLGGVKGWPNRHKKIQA
ncbi:hypothetical protein ACJMK2_034743 [Sinanodonta woodiana]|uniref:Uncharacterized protein n=1 Tax=Sinanodonta woodiana TaxID=1069815 RepID=A0ABD3WUC2_SINWO